MRNVYLTQLFKNIQYGCRVHLKATPITRPK